MRRGCPASSVCRVWAPRAATWASRAPQRTWSELQRRGTQTGNATFTFTAAPPLTVTGSPEKAVVGTTITVYSAGGSPTGTVTYATTSTGCRVTGASLTATAAGTCTVTATQDTQTGTATFTFS